MGDAVADEQTTRWCNLELEVVSPLIPDGSERVKATVSVTFVSEALCRAVTHEVDGLTLEHFALAGSSSEGTTCS